MAKPVTKANPAAGKAVARWDEKLAEDAQAAAAAEASAGGGQFFSARGGILAFNGAPVPDNTMAVVIVDGVFENVYYEGKFDPDTPTPPTCFAFARDEKSLAPHDVVVKAGQAQNATCKGCPHNEWATADTGRGKACRNTRRLAMIPAGELDRSGRFTAWPSADDFEKATLGMMKLPVTSVKGYATFVQQVANGLKRPPYAIFTKVRVVPDAKTQFRVLFEPIEKVPDRYMDAIMQRRDEAAGVIDQPYPMEYEDRAPAKPAAKAAGRRR